MSTADARRSSASTEAVFRLLRNIPWWGVIIAAVGLVVAFSVLTDVRYLDAIYFLFDLPWHKELIETIPVEGKTWSFTPGAKVPLRPRTYRLYAEFDRATAKAREDTVLHVDADAASDASATLLEDEQCQFAKWKIIPKQGLTMEQRWVYVLTEDGRVGWAQDEQFGRVSYEPVGESGLYILKVAEGAQPGKAAPIDGPTGEPVGVDTSTPTISGKVEAGSAVRIYDRYTVRQIIARVWTSKGVVMTLRATILGYALALVLGLIAGLMLVSNNPVTLAVSKLYVEVVRGIPLLVIILYAGYVLSPYLREATGGMVDLGGFPGALIGLGFGYGAYLAEVFRAGIQSIHRGQMEAARSLGMSSFQAMRHVILPQALRVVLPPLGNDFIAMLKDSSLISVVALPEILQQGRLWVSRTFRAFEGYNTVALFYLVMTLVLSLLVRLIERKTALPGRVEE
jgi:polar amino acid transport system permease protein